VMHGMIVTTEKNVEEDLREGFYDAGLETF
jgi:hypothetical protein